MALATYVKISTVTNLSDARYSAGMGVDAIGFRLEADQPGFVTPTVFHGITEWLSGVALVGEFLGTDAKAIQEAAREYPLDYIQVDDAALLPQLAGLSAKLILRIQPSALANQADLKGFLAPLAEQADWLLIEAEGEYSNPDLLTRLQNTQLPLILGIDISVDNALDIKEPHGIALKGGEEERPGFRDYEELMDILEALEVED